MGNLIRLAKHLVFRQDIRFLFIGTGSEVPHIQEEIAAGRLPNVVLADAVHPTEFRLLLRRCHVGLISLDRRLRTHNIPGKLLAYLEAGLPVLASLNPGNDLRLILEEAEAGLAYWNGEDEELSAAAIQLADDAPLFYQLSRHARLLASERFSANAAANQVVAALKSLSGIGDVRSTNLNDRN